MDLGLVFTDSTISGDGSNDIGRFFVTGHFDETNGECSWTKAYIGGHDVFYGGVSEGKRNWGVWNCQKSQGAFTSGRGRRIRQTGSCKGGRGGARRSKYNGEPAGGN